MFKKYNTIIYYTFLTILCGFIFRFYNLSFENLWFDEIVSFYIADPKISFFESYQRNNSGEGTPFLFNFLLKILHMIFGYTPNIGRYFSCAVSVLSIFSMIFLAKTIKNNNSYLLIIFLVSLNIFLIQYSQELRVYSLVFFLCTMTLIFYFQILKENTGNKYFSKNSFLFIILQILSILSHPFTIIIFGSIILYVIANQIFKKKINKLLNISIFIIFIFLVFYLPYYLIITEPYPSWISHPTANFYTNFYSSKFFGSRLLGLTHFIILFYLIFKFKEKFIKNLEPSITLIFILFFSYFVPIIFGYIYKPILAPRYIIFNLIPIMILISYLTFELRERKIKFFIIFIISILTLGNLWTETTIQQFLKERPSHKPQYTLALKSIDSSNYKNFVINMSFTKTNKNYFDNAINNYFQRIELEEKFNIDYFKIKEIEKEEYFWSICLMDLNESDCENIDTNKSLEIIEEKNYNSVNLKLIKFSE